jgi:concentrative nucleoside transporter, CNT family
MSIVSYFLEYNRYLNVVGILVILLVAWIFSRKRSAIDYKLVGIALFLQFIIAITMLKTNIGQKVVQGISFGINKILQCADAGSSFLFGSLANAGNSWGFIFAFKVLPVFIFFGALMSVLFHFGVIQWIVGLIIRVLQPLLGTSGSETLVAIANSFLGQTEAPLLIKDYLKGLTKSEMLTVMIAGMATISGAILVVYSGTLGVPAKHLLAASVMAIPASLLIAKMLYPETEQSETKGVIKTTFKPASKNVFDAIAIGTTDGLNVALCVGAMLIAFIALIALVNAVLLFSSDSINNLLSYVGIAWQMPTASLNMIFGYLCAPFAYLLGLTGNDALIAGQLLGTKIAVNEMVAYSEMVTMMLSERTIAILTYALCGFANFSSIGIQLGGIGALVPERRSWLSELGLLAVLGGTLANLLSAMIAGLLL